MRQFAARPTGLVSGETLLPDDEAIRSAQAVQNGQQHYLHLANKIVDRIDIDLTEASIESQTTNQFSWLVDAVQTIECAAPEVLAEARERNAKIIGNVALEENIQVKKIEERKRKPSLSEQLDLAAEGHQESLEELEINSVSSVSEMILKSGAKFEAYASVSPDGSVVQFGKTTAERQQNTLDTFAFKFPGLQDMISAEGQNGFTFESAHKNGLTKENRMVELSFIPDGSREQLEGSGLFLREAIGIIRTTEITEDGQVKFTSYLVGGTDQDLLPEFTEDMSKKDEESIEEQALKNRFDIKVLRNIYKMFGIKDTDKMSPTEILATPLLVPKDFDGIDFVMLYDHFASKETGKPVMMGMGGLYREYAQDGRQLTRADYEAQSDKSIQLQEGLQEIGKAARDELIDRRDEVGNDDYKAGRLLHEIAKNHAVAHIGDNVNQFDTKVFGAKAYFLLERRNVLIQAGDYDAARWVLEEAQLFADPTGCPGGAAKGIGNIGGDISGKLENSESDESANGDCEFISKECPKCGKKNVKTISTKTEIKGDCGCCVKK